MQGRKSVTQIETQAVPDSEQNGCVRTLNVSFLFGYFYFYFFFFSSFIPSFLSFFLSFFFFLLFFLYSLFLFTLRSVWLSSIFFFVSLFPIFPFFLSSLRFFSLFHIFLVFPSYGTRFSPFLHRSSVSVCFLVVFRCTLFFFTFLQDSTRKYLDFVFLLNQFFAIACIQVGFSLHSCRYAGCASASEKRRWSVSNYCQNSHSDFESPYLRMLGSSFIFFCFCMQALSLQLCFLLCPSPGGRIAFLFWVSRKNGCQGCIGVLFRRSMCFGCCFLLLLLSLFLSFVSWISPFLAMQRLGQFCRSIVFFCYGSKCRVVVLLRVLRSGWVNCYERTSRGTDKGKKKRNRILW